MGRTKEAMDSMRSCPPKTNLASWSPSDTQEKLPPLSYTYKSITGDPTSVDPDIPAKEPPTDHQ